MSTRSRAHPWWRDCLSTGHILIGRFCIICDCGLASELDVVEPSDYDPATYFPGWAQREPYAWAFKSHVWQPVPGYPNLERKVVVFV